MSWMCWLVPVSAHANTTLSMRSKTVVNLKDWLSGTINLTVPSAAAGNSVLIFARNESVLDYQTNSCSLVLGVGGQLMLQRGSPPSPPQQTAECAKVWDVIWGSRGDFVVAVNSTFYALGVAIPYPAWKVRVDTPSSLAHPSGVTGSFYYTDYGGRMLQSSVANAADLQKLQNHLGALTLGGSPKLPVYYEQGGGIVLVEYAIVAKGAILDQAAFDPICDQYRQNDPGRSRYMVCINLTNEDAPTSHVTAVGFDDVHVGNGHLWVNKPIDILTCRKKGRRLDLTISGSPGLTSTIYEPPPAVAAGLAPSTEFVCQLMPFPPRKAGADPVLTVKVTAKGEGEGYEEVAAYRQEFYLEREYRAALRTGLAGLYAPWEKKYRVRTLTEGNVGSEIVVEQEGVPTLDLALGLSFFLSPVGDAGFSMVPSWYVGLSFLQTGSKGADVFSAISTGPEISFGKDFSVGVLVGLRRSEKLNANLQPHSPVDSATLADHTVFYPAVVFGVMVNLSPYVWAVTQ